MRQGIMTQIDWEFIGAQLAREDDLEQTKFFKAFVRECKSWGTDYQVGMQLAGIQYKLTAEEREVLGMLSDKE